MYAKLFFGALLTFKRSSFFSDLKVCLRFPFEKAFDSRCFIFKPCVTHFNAATYLMAQSTVKRLTKRVDKFFR